MAIALDTSKAVPYVCAAERKLPKEQQTVWLIRPRSIADGKAIAQALKDDTVTHGSIVALRRCLKGWENFLNADGTPAQAKHDQAGMLTEESIALIPWDVKDEVAGAIMADASFKEATLGN